MYTWEGLNVSVTCISACHSLQKRIVRQRGESGSQADTSPGAIKRERIIRRAALEFKEGMYGILE